MASLRHIFKPVNVAEEREFEKQNVSRKLERYLKTNPLVRFETDAAYRAKVQHIQKGLEKDDGRPMEGLILDIGGNTAGEATILQQQGLNFIVGDINEVALDISRQRVKIFCLLAPEYVALDAHELPFANESFSAVTVIEALHHFPDYSRVLGEILRVLKPGGIFYSNEPDGLNPIRRLSEVRDRLRGTIKKVFSSASLSGCAGLPVSQRLPFTRFPSANHRGNWRRVRAIDVPFTVSTDLCRQKFRGFSGRWKFAPEKARHFRMRRFHPKPGGKRFEVRSTARRFDSTKPRKDGWMPPGIHSLSSTEFPFYCAATA